MPWSNVYLLPGLWATMLERQRERERKKERGLVKKWVSAKSACLKCESNTHTQIQTHTHTLRCEPISQLTAFLIQRVITGCQLSSHCLYFKPERNKADHIWTWSSEIYSTQPGHELHCNHLHDRKAPRFPQKHPHKWSSAQSPAAAAAAAAAANTAGLGRRSPSASATLTSVVYDDTKVRVGGFVLRSFGGSGDDRRLGGILVGGGALLWSRKKKKKRKSRG